MTNRLWWNVACLVLAGCTAGSGSQRPAPGAADPAGEPAASPGDRDGGRRSDGAPPPAGGKAAPGAPTTPAAVPDVPIGWGPVLEALPGAFGRPINGPEVAAVVKAVGGEPRVVRTDDGRVTLSWWDKGLSLAFGPDRTLASATFTGGKGMWNAVLDTKSRPYPSALPYGLHWDDGPEAVERKLGRPDPSATEWAAEYRRLGLKLGYVRRDTGPGTRLDELVLGKPPGGPTPGGPPGAGPPPPPAGVRADDSEARAVALVERLGGTVTRDGGRPGSPVTAVDLFLTRAADADLKELATLRHLGRLDLGATRVTDAGVKELAGLKTLADLTLGATKVTDAGVKDLAALDGLVRLNLSGTRLTDAGVRPLAALKNLTSLDLGGTAVTDVGLADLAPLGRLTHLGLKKVDFRTYGGIKAIAPLTTLTHLDLAEASGVAGVSLKAIAPLKNLTHLSLRFAELTDADLKELAPFRNLAALDLSGTKVTDAGLKDLAPFKSLASLDLFGTKVTDAGVGAIRAALPDCTVRR